MAAYYRRLDFIAQQPTRKDHDLSFDDGAQLHLKGEVREMNTEAKISFDLKAVDSMLSITTFRFGAQAVGTDWRILIGDQRYKILKVTPSYRKLEFIAVEER